MEIGMRLGLYTRLDTQRGVFLVDLSPYNDNSAPTSGVVMPALKFLGPNAQLGPRPID